MTVSIQVWPIAYFPYGPCTLEEDGATVETIGMHPKDDKGALPKPTVLTDAPGFDGVDIGTPEAFCI